MRTSRTERMVNVPAAVIIAAMLLIAAGVAWATGHPRICAMHVTLWSLTMVAIRRIRQDQSKGGPA